MDYSFTKGAFDTYKPINLALPNLAGNTFNKPSPSVPVGAMPKAPSAGGTNTPTVQTPRNTATVSSPKPLAQMTVAEAAASGQTDAYNKLVMGYSQPQPGYNPPAVNLKVPGAIPSSALNAVPNTTGMGELRKDKEQKVLTSKYAAEEENLLSEITKLRTGIAGLKGTQAQEYAAAEKNPGGQITSALNSDLSRLSKDQALELNARTGQLNAYLDNLELYQGYKPSIVGTPQLDDATGEAFVYLQDPTTGEFTTQSLGVVSTPNPSANYQKVGDAIVDPVTGEVIYQAPGEGYTLGKDQIRYDAQGNPVAYGGNSGGSGMGGYTGGTGVPSDLSRMVNVQGSFITSENARQAFESVAQSYIDRGEYENLRYYLRNQAVNNVPAVDQSGYRKNIEILKGLDKLDALVNAMEAKGIDSGILTGSWQSIQNKLGAKGDAELVTLGYKAQQAMDLITRQRTGAALNESEEKFYKKMVPGIFKGADLNKQLIQEFKDTLQNNTDSYLGLYFSPEEIGTLNTAAAGKKPSLEELFGN